jgi:hypothetical protein
MQEADKTKLLAEMDSLMRSLRQCDTQASAIGWMTRAYHAMDGATRMIKGLERMVREERDEARGLIFHIPKPKLEIVQSIPEAAVIAHRAEAKANYRRPTGETVVYPEFFLHPGLKPAPRAWTRADTLRLEAASKTGPLRIARKGR